MKSLTEQLKRLQTSNNALTKEKQETEHTKALSAEYDALRKQFHTQKEQL